MVNLRQEYGRTVRERDAAQAAYLETLQGDSDEAVRKPFLEWQRLEMLVKFLEATYPWLLDPEAVEPAAKPLSRRERIRAHHDDEARMGME